MSPRVSIALYLLALLLFGVGYLAILPPFEGFDEPAHYSSLRQIADTGTIPLYGASFLDREVTDYQGPVPYGSGEPPFDQRLTYAKFFAQPHLLAPYRATYRQALPAPAFQAGTELNWQAQHPPLYYVRLAPLEKAAESLSFATRLFLLRLASFLLAVAGVALGLLAVKRSAPARLGFMLYPVILPMFFPAFARLGNDSLCLFLVGLTVFLVTKILDDAHNKKASIALGLVLGLGLLTKAFFLLIMAALAGFFFVRFFRDKSGLRPWKNIALVFGPALLIGGGWYAYKFIVFGSLSGSEEAIRLAQQGGLIPNLEEKFSLYALGRGLVSTFVSYVWAGTWSLTRMPALAQAPLLALAVGSFGAFAAQVKGRPVTDPAWLCVWLLGMFGVGLFYHVLVGIALSGSGQTPGWYLHILMPCVAPALGLGLHALLQKPKVRWVFVGLLSYAALFQIMALWAQTALFTGCATKGDDKYYAFTGHAFCFDQAPVILDRLSVLGWPVLAAVGFGGGLVCVLILILGKRVRARPLENPEKVFASQRCRAR